MNIKIVDDLMIELTTPEKDIKLTARWDGCVHLERWFNGDNCDTLTSDNRDYMHICDLDEFIFQLNRIRDEARKHFGQDWPK